MYSNYIIFVFLQLILQEVVSKIYQLKLITK